MRRGSRATRQPCDEAAMRRGGHAGQGYAGLGYAGLGYAGLGHR
jgi:hypothetical protein